MARRDSLGSRRGPVVAAAITLLIGLICSAVLGVWLVGSAERDAEETFTESADQTAVAVEREVEGYFDELRDIGAFLANVPAASGDQFTGFVEGSGIFEQLPSLVGVLFLHQVPDADLAAFVARTQAANPEFTLVTIGPTAPGERHFVLTQYVPGSVDLDLPIGTDITPIKAVTSLIDAADRQGGSIAGSFQDDPLLLDIAEATDFEAIDVLLGLDFFIGVRAVPTDGDGVANGPTVGWVGAPVDDFDDVLAAASKGQPENLGVSLTLDLTDTGLNNTTDLERAARMEGKAGSRADAAFDMVRSFKVENVEFRLVVWSTADADALPSVVPLVVIGSAVGSLLAAGVVYLRLRTRQRDRSHTTELAEREQFQRDILDSMTNPTVVLDARGLVVAANPAWWALLDGAAGRPVEHRLQVGYLEVLGGHLRAGEPSIANGVGKVLRGSERSFEVDAPIEEGAGHRWYSVRVTPLRGRQGGAVVVHSDVTERKRSHDELEFRATRDNLTGLLNRTALESETDAALERAAARGAHVAVLFVDVDGFKPINDTFGHAVGDEVLRTVAHRLTRAVRATDRVARFGGDEFVVLIGPLDDEDVARRTADRILQAFELPIDVSGMEIPVAVSVGVAQAHTPSTVSRSALIDAADEAMYASKQAGGARATLAP